MSLYDQPEGLQNMLGGIIGGMNGLNDEHNPNSKVTMDDENNYEIESTFIANKDVQTGLTTQLNEEVKKEMNKVSGGGTLGFAGQVDLPGIEDFSEGEAFTAPELSYPGGNNFFVPLVSGGNVSTQRFETLVDTMGGVEKFVSGGVLNSGKQVCTKYTQYKSDIENNLSNLIVLKKFIDEGFTKLYTILSTCEPSVSIEVSSIKDVHDQVLKEVDNQIAHLQEILDVSIKPTHKDLSDALDKFTTFDKVAQLLLPYEYGTSEASDRLAIAYTGVYELKNQAMKVKKALDDANIKFNEYSSLKNINDLTTRLIKSLSNTKSVNLSNLIEAISILKDNFKNRKSIVDFINNNKKMDVSIISKKQGGDKDNVGFDESKLGRIQSDNSSTVLSKKLKRSEKTVSEIFKLFIFDVNQKFDEIKKSTNFISTNIGSDIVYNDNLVNFINAYENMSELSNNSLYYSLIGLKNNSIAKNDKSTFLDNLKIVSDSIDPLVVGKYGIYFKNIKTNINDLIKVVDTYTDVLKSSSTVGSIKTGGDSTLFPKDDLVNDNIVSSSTQLIKETANKLRFYGNLIAMKHNLSAASTQFKSYSEKYEDLLGKTIGNKLSLLNSNYVNILKSISSTEDKTNIGYHLTNYNKTAPNKLSEESLKGFVKLQYEAKEGLYKTIEAVDIYLMNFTQHIQATPEEVANIEKMLSSVQIISKWFTNQSGNDLISLFESFPDADNTKDGIIDKLTNGKKVADEVMDKEYIQLTKHADIMKLVDPTKMKDILEKCKKSLEGVSVLKNIIATFVYVGDKFKGTTLHNSMFMSPNVIYKNLFKYLWVSSFNINLYNELSNIPDLKSVFGLSLINNQYGSNNTFTVGYGVHGGVEDITTISEVNDKITTNEPNSINSIVEENKTLEIVNDKKDTFKLDDEYFALLLKAMVSKIYTVIGTYSLINDPTNLKNLVHNQTRIILGGMSEPKIINEALELYVRVPLLIEFYRDIFDNGNESSKNNIASTDDTPVITYIPDVGSIWSNILSVIFDKSKYIDNNIYTKQNLDNIINEINNVYHYYSKQSSKDNIIITVINGLIQEINKNYGILQRKDINNYYELIKKYENPNQNMSVDLTNNLNFDILDADNEYDLPAPSKNYTKSVLGNDLLKYKRKMIDDKLMIDKFRTDIYNSIKPSNIDNISTLSFRQYIKLYKEELNASNANDKKYTIVMKAINNSNDSNINNKQYYILYHELIIAPLNCLEYLHKLTASFVSEFNVAAKDNKRKALGLLFRFTSINKLVSLKYISSTQLMINYNELQELVENLIDSIKNTLQKFKIIIDKDLITSAETKLYEIEEEFLTKLIQNKNNEESKTNNLEYVTTQINNITNIVNSVTEVDINTMIKFGGGISTPKTKLELDMYKSYIHTSRRWESISGLNIMKDNKTSLANSLNHLIETYLNTFYDISSKKIYSKLLNNFNNTMINLLSNYQLGYNNYIGEGATPIESVILNNESITDFPTNNDTVALSANVTFIVKTLLNRSVNPQILDNKYHVVNDLSEVSPHIIEKYRAQLPSLIKLFNIFIKKCMFIKHIYLQKNTVSKLSETVDNIIEYCNSLLLDANAVLSEVNQLDNNTKPMFMELKQNFIRNYFNNVDELPFMPLSILTYILNPNHGSGVYINDNSTYALKFQYGIKNILNSNTEYKLSEIVYVNELLKSYNSSVNNIHVLNNDNVNKLLSTNINVLQFANDINYTNYLALNDGHNLVIGSDKFDTETYFFKTETTLQTTMNMVENTIKESSVNELFKSFAGKSTTLNISTLSRTQAKILNIIDLNVVPINVHALLREIPLINIYNYAHTFNGIINDTISTTNDNSEKMLNLLLNNPYRPISKSEISGSYGDLLTKGIPGLNLNIPRYLSDQIYNKLLLKNTNTDIALNRANTKLVQNLVFLCNLQRVTRVYIKSKLDNINSRIVEKIKITSDQITDYVGKHQEYDDNEFQINIE